MRIHGKIENVEILDDRVTYDITQENTRYYLHSRDEQAVKDAIFLREGQTIRIDGTPGEGMILVKNARIDIRDLGKT